MNPTSCNKCIVPLTGKLDQYLSPFTVSEKSATSVHVDFQPTDSTDIVIQSTNGIIFHLHRKYLEAHAGAFHAADDVSAKPGDVTHLTESGEVLGIMFGFVYPRKPPSLRSLEFGIVGQLAEAVEKYEVFSAMYACESRLRELAPKFPAEVLAHGIKHDYPDLIDAATPHFGRKNLAQVAVSLPSNLLVPWCKYREAWDKAFTEVLEHEACRYGNSMENIRKVMQWQKMDNITALRNIIDDIPEPITIKCSACGREGTTQSVKFTRDQEQLASLAKLLVKKINAIPPFTRFI